MTDIVAAVGAGRMGRGIAIAFAYAGYHVHLIDAKRRDADAFAALSASARQEIRDTLGMMAGFGMLRADEPEGMLDRVALFDREGLAAGVQDAGVIFEAVPETLQAKAECFELVSNRAAKDAIVASTTSTILSNDLQSLVRNPKRFLNAHWLNPAYLVPLVEISPGDVTDPAVTLRLKSLLENIGKVPVVCAASPGYIVPRIQMLAMNEAARMVEEGVASAADIDKATTCGFGFRFAILGMLEFIDWGGGDILYHASRYMTGAMESERFSAPDIIQKHMFEGRIGLRDGQGFMNYEGLDVPAYQKARIGQFVAMLQHLEKLPLKG